MLEVRLRLANFAHVARQAVALMVSKDTKAKLKTALQQKRARIQAEAERRYAAYIKALREVVGPERAASIEPPKPRVRLRMAGRPTWLRDQLEDRLRKVESITETAWFVPIYALEHPEEFKRHRALLPSSDDYERRVREQLAAQRSWLGCKLFGV